jgi:hypothetical protein
MIGIVVLAAATTMPYYVTGDELYERCRYNPDKRVFCRGYIVGVVDTVETVGYVAEKPIVCLPAGVPVTHLIRITVNYLRDNPEKRRLEAPTLVAGALQGAYRCP